MGFGSPNEGSWNTEIVAEWVALDLSAMRNTNDFHFRTPLERLHRKRLPLFFLLKK